MDDVLDWLYAYGYFAFYRSAGTFSRTRAAELADRYIEDYTPEERATFRNDIRSACNRG